MSVLFRIKRGMTFDQARILQGYGLAAKVTSIPIITIDVPNPERGVATGIKLLYPWRGKKGLPLAGWVHMCRISRDCALTTKEARRWSLWALWKEFHRVGLTDKGPPPTWEQLNDSHWS